jgi:hypothetical protein
MIVIYLIVMLVIPASLEAATRYVRSTCTNGVTTYNPNTNSCTGGTATVHNTIANALSAAATNDTILIRAGTYNEVISHTQGPTGPLTVAAYPGNCVTAGTIGPGGGCEVVTINGSAGRGTALVEARGSYTFDGLILDANSSQYGVQTWGDNIILKNMDIHDATNAFATDGNSTTFAGQGIEITENVLATQVLNSKIHDNGKFADHNGDGRAGHGIYWQGSNGTVDGSEIYNNGHEGIQLYCNANLGDCPTGIGNSNDTIRNSRVHNNGLIIADCGITAASNLSNALPHKIYNNVIYNNQGNGLCLDNGAGSGQIAYSNTSYNNGLAGSGGGGITLSRGSGHIVQNNISWGNPTDLYNFGSGGSVTATNNLCGSNSGWPGTPCNVTSNPLFVNASAGNFQLQSGSPAIGKGLTLSAPYNTDITGGIRSVPFDLGAYEFVVGGIVTVSITGSTPAGCLTSCTVSTNTLNLSGTASTTLGTISSVTFSTDRGSSGGASGTTSFTTNAITLLSGVNNVTVTATDSNNITGSALVVVTYTPTFPGNTLAGAWGFEEGSGSSATDSSGNTNTGTLVNTPTRVGGKYGQGIQLNGTTQYISVNDSNSLDFTQSFTLSAWVNSAVTATGAFRIAIAKNSGANAGGPNHPYELFTSVLGYCGNGGVAGFVTANTMTTGVCDPGPLQPGVWTHIAATYDGTNLKLYRQGVLLQTVAATGFMTISTQPLTIGASEFANEYFQGIIDEVRVYNYALALTDGKVNTSPGAACGSANYTAAGTAIWSIVGDMNCSVVPSLFPPINVKVSGTVKLSGTTKLGK